VGVVRRFRGFLGVPDPEIGLTLVNPQITKSAKSNEIKKNRNETTAFNAFAFLAMPHSAGMLS
jgi:hypothetical protein